MKKFFKKIIEAITAPFICFAVTLDESRRINEGGTWDKYNARKNRRASRKAGAENGKR